jgi:hypothetical protein
MAHCHHPFSVPSSALSSPSIAPTPSVGSLPNHHHVSHILYRIIYLVTLTFFFSSSLRDMLDPSAILVLSSSLSMRMDYKFKLLKVPAAHVGPVRLETQRRDAS